MPTKTVKPLDLFIFGSSGRMGTEISSLISKDKRFRQVLSLDKAKMVLDFSSPEGNLSLLKDAKKYKGLYFLIGTTGLSTAQKNAWNALACSQGHIVLFAPNTSLGIFVLAKALVQFSKHLLSSGFDVEIIETHHNQKKDAPSGTALFLAHMIHKEFPKFKIVNSHEGLRKPRTIGVHAVRGGGIFGEHEVRFISKNEEVVFSHRAFSRGLFASGALDLAVKLSKLKAPKTYSVDEIE